MFVDKFFCFEEDKTGFVWIVFLIWFFGILFIWFSSFIIFFLLFDSIIILLSSKKKEIHLKYDLENNVNLIKFSEGKIDISFNENLDKNFVRNLSKKLLEWTGVRWVITLTKEKGQKTFAELQSTKKKELLDQEKKGEIYKKFKNIFSDGELLDVTKED